MGCILNHLARKQENGWKIRILAFFFAGQEFRKKKWLRALWKPGLFFLFFFVSFPKCGALSGPCILASVSSVEGGSKKKNEHNSGSLMRRRTKQESDASQPASWSSRPSAIRFGLRASHPTASGTEPGARNAGRNAFRLGRNGTTAVGRTAAASKLRLHTKTLKLSKARQRRNQQQQPSASTRRLPGSAIRASSSLEACTSDRSCM